MKQGTNHLQKSKSHFMQRKNKYYHLTAPENAQSIAEKGICANENGQIFLFENKELEADGILMRVSDSISYNQVFIDSYDIWEVSSIGIKGSLEQDLVGEITAKYQFVLHQPSIKSAACRLIRRRKVDVYAVINYPRAFYGLTKSGSSRPND